MHFWSSDAEPVEIPTGGNCHVGCGKLAGNLGEQQLGANPGIDSVAAEVRQTVKSSDGFVPLDMKLDLPTEAVQFHHEGGGQPRARHSREHHHVLRGRKGFLSHRSTLFPSRALTSLLCFVGWQKQGAQPANDRLATLRMDFCVPFACDARTLESSQHSLNVK
jgi:hypothetical protein